MGEVAIRAVGKLYGATRVLDAITLTIENGEMMVVLGPSGCGKSTLLRMIAGLEVISEGEIAIAGRRVNELEPKDRDIAMVFQNYALYPHMRVFDNMAYGLRNAGTPRAEIKRKVEEAAGILGLGDLLQRKPRQLSGGQRQRVAMGRAIVREPAVFLFDEPLSNLDAKLRVQMRLEIRQLQRRLGTTGVYVTHDQVEAMTLGDRMVILNAGRIEQIGAPLEVYERPASTFVAGFIGSPAMNLLPARFTDDGRRLEAAGGQVRLPIQGPAEMPVTLGFRPEHLHVHHGGGPDVTLDVDWIEALGADTVVHGHCGADAATITVRLEGGTRIGYGDRLPLALDPRRAHLFDVTTGARLSFEREAASRVA
ncbi:MAG: sn-glycerol-3-phosphate ABC transporter ATP-binding protein UgpC [Geminicoccaceae bacterium]